MTVLRKIDLGVKFPLVTYFSLYFSKGYTLVQRLRLTKLLKTTLPTHPERNTNGMTPLLNPVHFPETLPSR
jgi:hypothetical protein